MKVLAAVILALGSVSALKSGPYLPSGWKPNGPAFYLPSEQKLPVSTPPQDFILQESEASGSEFLREYGPPKVSLPDAAPESSFDVVQTRLTEQKTVEADEKTVEVATGVVTDLKYEIAEEGSTTEAATTEAAQEVVPAQPEERSKLVEVPVENEAEEETTAAVVEVEATESTGEQVEKVESVKNIAETIDNLEKEQATKVQLSQDLTEQRVELKSGNVENVPEGFLEYGPPGFTEYGPPNLGPRNGEDVKSEDEKVENNETRKRRFSPKFRSSKAKKH